MDDLDIAYLWITKIRKKYSHNCDIWNLRRNWDNIKLNLLNQLNTGAYEFSPLDRYEHDDAIISLWTSQDMIALKLITNALERRMANHIPQVLLSHQGPWWPQKSRA